MLTLVANWDQSKKHPDHIAIAAPMNRYSRFVAFQFQGLEFATSVNVGFTPIGTHLNSGEPQLTGSIVEKLKD
jgi:hypothetical protein